MRHYIKDALPTTNIDTQGVYYIKTSETRFVTYIRNNEDTTWLLQQGGAILNNIVTYNTTTPRPDVGEVGKLYIDTDNDKAYIWDAEGTAYVGFTVNVDLSGYLQDSDLTIEDIATEPNLFATPTIIPNTYVNGLDNELTPLDDWKIAKIDVSAMRGEVLTWQGINAARTTIISNFYDENDTPVATRTSTNTSSQPATTITIPNNATYFCINIKSSTDADDTCYENFEIYRGAVIPSAEQRITKINNIPLGTATIGGSTENTPSGSIPSIFANLREGDALVLIQTGQSNTTEQASNVDIPTEDNRTYTNLKVWDNANNAWINYFPGYQNSDNHNFNLKLAQICEELGVTLYVFNYAVSGTGIVEHLDGGSVYTTFWTQAQLAINTLRQTKRVFAVELFVQGERDSTTSALATDYYNQQQSWITLQRNNFGAGLNIILSGIYETDANDITVNNAKKELIKEGVATHFYSVVGFPDKGDSLHRNYAGYQLEGEAIFSSLIKSTPIEVVDDLPYTY